MVDHYLSFNVVVALNIPLCSINHADLVGHILSPNFMTKNSNFHHSSGHIWPLCKPPLNYGKPHTFPL